MFKQLTVAVAGLCSVVLCTTAGAIAPGFEQLKTCQRQTASRYGVPTGNLKLGIRSSTPKGYYVNWRVARYQATGYCFVNKANKITEFVVTSGPRPGQGQGGQPSLGPNERIFNGLPGYGNVVVNRGAGIATGDKQYFTVRRISDGRTYKWYARCANNSDQVYDQSGKYVGNTPKLTVMFPYVCEFSPISPSQPKPPIKPQPR